MAKILTKTKTSTAVKVAIAVLAVGGVGVLAAAAVITGIKKPIVTLNAGPNPAKPGQPVTLVWKATNATSCFASGDWSGKKDVPRGSEVVSPEEDKDVSVYKLECCNKFGKLSFCTKEAYVKVYLKSLCTGKVPKNATLCYKDDVYVKSETSRTVAFTCHEETKCEYLCNKHDGYVKSGNECILATKPTVDFTVSSKSITLGESATLSWKTNNAASCIAGGSWSGKKDVPKGSEKISPKNKGKYNYKLECYNSLGIYSGLKTVTVNVE